MPSIAEPITKPKRIVKKETKSDDDLAPTYYVSKDLDTASAVDPSERLKFLNEQLAAAQAHKLEAKNSLAAADENTKRLKQRQADLEKQVTAKLDELQRPLRLPKEHETGKRVIYIIARYGHIYLCRNYDLSRNESDMSIWKPRDSSNESGRNHMKTTATTEEVSSHPGENGCWSQEWRRNTARAGKNR